MLSILTQILNELHIGKAFPHCKSTIETSLRVTIVVAIRQFETRSFAGAQCGLCFTIHFLHGRSHGLKTFFYVRAHSQVELMIFRKLP